MSLVQDQCARWHPEHHRPVDQLRAVRQPAHTAGIGRGHVGLARRRVTVHDQRLASLFLAQKLACLRTYAAAYAAA